MSLEAQLVSLATQIGMDIAELQSALDRAKANLQSLQDQVDAGGQQTSGITMADVTTLLSAGLGDPERDLAQVYRDAVMNVMLNPPGIE